MADYSDAVAAIFDRIEAEGLNPVWIALADREATVPPARDIKTYLPIARVG